MFTDVERSHRRAQMFGAGLMVLAVLTVGEGWYFARQAAATTACQAKFNDDFAKNLMQRNRWAKEDRDQLTALVNTMLTTANPQERRAALEQYAATVAKNDANRAAHPLPDLSKRDCRDPRWVSQKRTDPEMGQE